jgi:hypothetical protein
MKTTGRNTNPNTVINILRSLISFLLKLKKEAIAKHVPSLATSDGWKEAGPNANHDFEPFFTDPTNTTKIRKTIETPYIGKENVFQNVQSITITQASAIKAMTNHIDCLPTSVL